MTERDTTRCVKCNRARSKYQKSPLRRNYERDVKAASAYGAISALGLPRTSGVSSAKIVTLGKNDSANEWRSATLFSHRAGMNRLSRC